MESALVVPSRVRSSALLEHCVAKRDGALQIDDSAFCALTDFAQTSIDDALADMLRLGVHALLVTEEQSEQDNCHLLGLLRRTRGRDGADHAIRVGYTGAKAYSSSGNFVCTQYRLLVVDIRASAWRNDSGDPAHSRAGFRHVSGVLVK
jgi:hypothetical protein